MVSYPRKDSSGNSLSLYHITHIHHAYVRQASLAELVSCKELTMTNT